MVLWFIYHGTRYYVCSFFIPRKWNNNNLKWIDLLLCVCWVYPYLLIFSQDWRDSVLINLCPVWCVCLTGRPRPRNTVFSPVCVETCLSAWGCFSSFSNSGLLKLTAGEKHRDIHTSSWIVGYSICALLHIL